MRKLFLLFLSAVSAGTLTAQTYWSAHTADASKLVTDKAVARLSFPKEYKLFDLDAASLKQDLFKVVTNRSTHSTVITLPNAGGQLEQFEVVEASNFEPALQERFPDIRAFSGRSLSDGSATLKLSYSPYGIQTMVFRTGQPAEFIEAYSQDHTVYAVFRSQRSKGAFPWTCSTPDADLATGLNQQVAGAGITGRSGGDLKTLRLAQSVTAEYSNFFGATSSAQESLVLAAVNATLTRCNGCYEKDLALHLNLIANTTSVFYYNPATDPYSAAAQMSQWNAQLQSTLTSVIGEANYDIGHLFGASGGGGNAGCIGCICVNGSKGSGITSPADAIPQGDNFDIDYVVHEVGHQLGGNHTFSMSNEGTGVNKEVGSGITIMAYAGITAQDVAPHSIDIYHEASIAQIQANLAAKTCPVTTSIAGNNATPVVNAGADFTIPISTPFALTGSATDADASDVLTYCWEQNDNAGSTQTGASSVASPTKATGPNWLSFSPTTSPTRLFPKLATILAGLNVSGPLTGGDAGANTEALSSVSRTLNFRLTVRDNHPFSSTAPVAVGQTQFDDMIVTVTNTSGPFAVTAPNTAVTWGAGTSQTVTWSVNNTTAAPVSCANVKISISTDGGNTFSTLVASTPNDGSEVVTVPNTLTTAARIKVEAVGNIFFDISNANFTIGTPPACGDPAGLTSSAITTTSATVSWTAVASAVSYDVDYKAASSATWINAATGTAATSVNLGGLTQGTLYDWRVRANCSGGSGNYVQAQFTTTSTVCSAPLDVSTNGTRNGAAVIPFNTDVNGLINPSGDIDFYRFAITGAGTITLTLTTLPANYDLRLYRNNTLVASSANAGTASETINFTASTGTYYARVTGATSTDFNATSCYTLRVQLGTATGKGDGLIAGGNVTLFPNPVTDKVNIRIGELKGTATVYVFDMYGRQVLQQTSSQPLSQLDVSKLSSGVYTIRVINDGKATSMKVVKE